MGRRLRPLCSLCRSVWTAFSPARDGTSRTPTSASQTDALEAPVQAWSRPRRCTAIGHQSRRPGAVLHRGHPPAIFAARARVASVRSLRRAGRAVRRRYAVLLPQSPDFQLLGHDARICVLATSVTPPCARPERSSRGRTTGSSWRGASSGCSDDRRRAACRRIRNQLRGRVGAAWSCPRKSKQVGLET